MGTSTQERSEVSYVLQECQDMRRSHEVLRSVGAVAVTELTALAALAGRNSRRPGEVHRRTPNLLGFGPRALYGHMD